MYQRPHLIILLLVFLFVEQNGSAQNLVPNPSFEEYYSCPPGIGPGSNMNHCEYWSTSIGTTTDYYHLCGDGAAGVPLNMAGYQMARTGDAYCGIVINAVDTSLIGEWNEYLIVNLVQPLNINQAYRFKMFVNLAVRATYTTYKIGALFSNNVPLALDWRWIPATPQVENNPGNVISDTENWMVIEQSFIADSSYQVLTIGNFSSSADTEVNDAFSAGWTNEIELPYFLIDDVSLTPIHTICLGDSISLYSQADSLHAWAESSNPDEIISTEPVLTVSPSVNTIYSNYSGADTIEYIVEVMGDGLLNLGNDTNLCAGQTLPLNVATSNSEYLWQDNSTSYEYLVTQAGTYWVQVTNSCGAFSDTINVTYNTIPVDLGPDTVLCAGQTVTLNPNIPDADYFWHNFSTNPSFTSGSWITEPNYYWVQVTTSDGCGADTIHVNYNIFDNQSLLDDNAYPCDRDTLALTASLLNSTYQWSTGSTDSTIYVLESGSYWVIATNDCFSIFDEIEVDFKPLPYFELPNDTTLCYSENLIIDINSVQYAGTWWNTSYTSPITVEEEGQYIATAMYQNCFYRDTINVAFEDCEMSLNIPNVFTPNGDGINDLFVLEGANVNSINVQILNRWGQVVFESNDMNISWDGKTRDNRTCPAGTYFYVIMVKNETRSKHFNGSVTLLR